MTLPSSEYMIAKDDQREFGRKARSRADQGMKNIGRIS